MMFMSCTGHLSQQTCGGRICQCEAARPSSGVCSLLLSLFLLWWPAGWSSTSWHRQQKMSGRVASTMRCAFVCAWIAAGLQRAIGSMLASHALAFVRHVCCESCIAQHSIVHIFFNQTNQAGRPFMANVGLCFSSLKAVSVSLIGKC